MHEHTTSRFRQLGLLPDFPDTPEEGLAPGDVPRHVEDLAYLVRGNPLHPEHDARGLRNRRTGQPGGLVVIGGAQVYGVSVRAEHCWPQRLHDALGGGVYNAGMEGWGSVQFALAAEELLRLAPRQVLVCLHTGGDLAGAFRCARTSGSPLARSFFEPQWAALPPLEFPAKDKAALAQAGLMEEQPGLVAEDALALLAQRGEPDVNPCVIESSRFYLTENRSFAALDLDHAAIAAGLTITDEVLAHLRGLSLTYGFALGVVLIPTREYLASLRLDDATVGNREGLERLGMAEAAVLGELRAACARLSVRCFDLSGYLKHFLGGRIYPQNSRSGLPNAKGCELIARYVRERVLPGLVAAPPLRAAVGGPNFMY